MTYKQKIKLQNIINKDIEKTKINIDSLLQNSKAVEVGCCLDGIARSELQLESSKNLQRANELKQKLQKLSSIDFKDNHFGICAMCDEEIEFKRLEIIPYTNLCFECSVS